MTIKAVDAGRNRLLPAALRFTIWRWGYALPLVASLGLMYPHLARTQPVLAEAPSGELVEAQQLHEQSVKLQKAGQYTEARPLAERALAVREKALGSQHPDVAKSLASLAILYTRQGDYIRAETLFRRALAIRQKALGPEHPDVAASLDNLGVLYYYRGDYAEAEPLHRQALAIREKTLEPEHLHMAKSFGNLANLYSSKGNYAEAEPLFRRSLVIFEKALGPEHPDVALSLSNLANMYEEQGNYTEAEPLHKQALAIRQKALEQEHQDIAASLDNLGALYYSQGKYAEAEPLHRQALAIFEKALGPEHPDVAISLHNLASLYLQRSDYARAEPLFERALAIWEKALGPQYPGMTDSLYELALLYLGQNRLDDAREALRQALDIQEHNLALNLTPGSQARNRAYLASLKDTADLATWLHLHHLQDDPQAATLALSAALSRKGRVLEEATLALARLRRRLPPESQQPLQQLADTRARLATLVLKEAASLPPEQYQAQVRELRTRVRQLEDSLADYGADFQALTRPLTLQTVQHALPRDAVLVEFVLYRPLAAKAATPAERFGPPRYAAYLLPPVGPPQGFDLGEAKQMDALIRYWRSWLLDPTSPSTGRVQKLARQLHQKLLAPLQNHPGVKHLLLAPDGQINTLPFAALIGPDGRTLLQKYTLTYLVSGRELPRLEQAAPAPQSSPLVLGGPDFARAAAGPLLAARPTTGGRAAEESAGTKQMRRRENLRSSALTGFTVRPLPGARQEAAAVARLMGLPSTQLLTGERATENALKAARSPAVLHLATHGFFLQDQDGAEVGAGTQEPLLRSGVALAGFNARASGSEDGVLTALEAQGLDLDGTQLAVLSACQSGAGPVLGGEGVQGLRRALALAGTRSQVLALWPVEDLTTAWLIERFYRGLAAGVGRSEALRQAQLAVSVQPGRSHPYWWGAFAASGDWRPVQFSKRRR